MEELSHLLLINVATLGFGVVAVAVLIAAVSDAVWFKVPNWLTFPLIVSGIVYHGSLPSGSGWLFAGAGFLFGFMILLPFFVLGGIGAGDVKLLGGIGAWLGLHDVVAVFLVFGTLASVCSLVVILAQRRTGGLGGTIRRPWRALADALGGNGERVEEVARQDPATRRQRMIPLATTMAAAILILMVGALVA